MSKKKKVRAKKSANKNKAAQGLRLVANVTATKVIVLGSEDLEVCVKHTSYQELLEALRAKVREVTEELLSDDPDSLYQIDFDISAEAPTGEQVKLFTGERRIADYQGFDTEEETEAKSYLQQCGAL